MASALCLDKVYVHAPDSFGLSVGDCLRSRQVSYSRVSLTECATLQEGALLVVAGVSLDPDTVQLLDQKAFEQNFTLLPVTFSIGLLRIGPLVKAGHSCCWQCWLRRLDQHAAPRSIVDKEMNNIADSSSPQAPLLAWMAACHIADLCKSGAATLPYGKVWDLELGTLDLRSSTGLGIHGCPRCGLQRPEPSRSCLEMSAALAYLWTKA